MKYWFCHIILLLSLNQSAQSVFARLRNDMSLSKTNSLLIDSCASSGYCKDSVLYYKGLIQLKQNNATEAKNISKELGKTFPAFNETHYLNGLIYLSGKNYGKSVNEFTLLLSKNPKHLKGLYNRALAFGLMEEYEKAIQDLNSCIALKPIYAQAYYSRAYWHEYLGNYPAAIKDYETTINIDPKNYDAYIGLAYIYRGLKSNEKSCEVINRAIVAGSQIAEEVKDNFCK